ncbi:MAG: cytochrome c biogenesis protein CcdA [Armatimonadota bacterium]
MARHLRIILLALLALAALSGAVAQQAKVSLRLDADSAKPGAVIAGVVVVSIPSGLHANQNPPNVEGFIPVSVSLKSGGTLVSARYPKGEMKTFGFSDEPLAVYEGDVRIPIQVRLPADAQGKVPVEVAVQVQMCDDSSCFPPEVITASAFVTIEKEQAPPPTNSGSSGTTGAPATQDPPARDSEDALPPDAPVSSDEQPFDMEDGAAPGFDPELDAAAAESSDTQEQAASTDPLAGVGSYPSRASEVPLDEQGQKTNTGLLALLIAGFLAGLLLNLTPCVYPLIPITLSFFSQQAKESTGGKFALGVSYMFGIALSFGVFGAISVLVGKGFGTMFQSPWFNLGLFGLLFGLSLSMFGVYEIRLPGFLQKQLRGRSGTAGAFMMGSLLGVGAAPCGTALIAALAIVVAQQGSFPLGISVFTAIGLGLGLPYVFLAVAGAQLPRSADWLTTLKRIMGLVIILFAVTRYLGPALQGLSANIPYVATLWINAVVFFGAAAYLLWFDRSFSSKVVAFIRTFSILFMAWYGSGYIYDATTPPPEGIKWEPFTIEAFEQAVGSGTPVVVDGTANWCAACMEIEHKTFTDPDVIRAMRGVRAFKMDLSTGVDPAYQRATQDHFGWQSLPHIRFYNPQGTLTHVQKEFVGPDGWLQLLRDAGAIP